MKKLTLALMSLALLGVSSGAMAYNVTIDTGVNLDTVLNRPFSTDITFAGTTPGPAGNGTLTIVAKGDFDRADEFMDLSGEGTDLGDLYVTGLSNVNQTATVTIPQATLAAMTADTAATFTFAIDALNDAGWAVIDSVNLSYTPVPVPAALPLFASGLLVMLGRNFRRKKLAVA